MTFKEEKTLVFIIEVAVILAIIINSEGIHGGQSHHVKYIFMIKSVTVLNIVKTRIDVLFQACRKAGKKH